MERSWLEKFYTECGREVSLAYNVLNHTNTWGVTLITVFLGTIFVSAIEIKNSEFVLHYPTTIHWFLVIGAWIALMRFFVRSALGLANMYRWNELIYASSKVLALEQDNLALPVYIRNFSKKIYTYYYYCFKSPKPRYQIIWHNLKLMYLWFFIAIFALFVWGLFVLVRGWQYYFGISLFIFSTFLEVIWFLKWHGLKYEKLDLEEEPEITDVWLSTVSKMACEEHEMLVLGFCSDGPFQHVISLLQNPEVKWLPWSYHSASIQPQILNELFCGTSLTGMTVGFTRWPTDFHGTSVILRFGKIDYAKATHQCLRMTIQLDDMIEPKEKCEIKVENPKILCFYADRN